MARTVFITGLEPGGGKSTVALGMTELLSRRVERVGVFRPLVRDMDDPIIELLRDRYQMPAAPAYGATYAQAAQLIAEGGQDRLVAHVLDGYHTVARLSDAVVVLGTDFGRDTGDSGIHEELALNARLATEFDAVVLAVVDGRSRTPRAVAGAIRAAYHVLSELDSTVLAVVANRVEPGQSEEVLAAVGALPVPAYAVPDESAISAPTLGQVADALVARRLLGDEAAYGRDVLHFVVGAAQVPVFLDHLDDGCVVITPGDRADLITAAVTAHAAGMAAIAGIVVTLGEQPDERVLNLVRRLRTDVPVVLVQQDSFETVAAVNDLEGRLTTATPRKVEAAVGAFESCVDGAELMRRLAVTRSGRVTPLMFEYTLIDRARSDRKRIVLPEGTEERILRAADVLLRRGVADLILLGPPADITRRARELGLDTFAGGDQRGTVAGGDQRGTVAGGDQRGTVAGGDQRGTVAGGDQRGTVAGGDQRGTAAGGDQRGPASLSIVDPFSSDLRDEFAHRYAKLRAHRGVNLDMAQDMVRDVNYFGTLMVASGLADAMVSGATHPTADTIRPAFEIIRRVPGLSVASSVFFMCLADRVLVYGDCAINPDPDAAQLADIALSSASTAAQFGVEPRVAMLSYSTGASGRGADVDKVAEATRLVRAARPDLPVEGPIQYDAAIDPVVARAKLPGSDVAGRATVFIFPDLNTGNNTYKAVQRSAGAVAVGPVLQGLRRPVNDLSRGATVADIVNTVAITAVQAQSIPAEGFDE